MKALALALMFTILLCACADTNGGTEMAQTAKTGDTVLVEYTGKLDNGDVFDSSEGKEPLKFTLGSGMVIPGFEEAITGMNVGEEKTVTLEPEQAYGPHNPELIQVVPISAFGEGAELKTGDVVGVTEKQSGRQFPASVTKVEGDNITIDLNHQLAGKALTFELKLMAIE
ncbi:MAG: FKBP-type peptidyl-prolyl cis-trans isomerase [Candidatus Woesearchaeota archaeon]